jgi:hypothetical protein
MQDFAIDLRFLNPRQARRVKRKLWQKIVQSCGAAVSAFRHRSELPYVPVIFVVDFYIYEESIIGKDPEKRSRVAQKYAFACLSVDPDLPKTKWAIYLLYNYVKKATSDSVTTTLAHELTHFYMRMRGVSHSQDILQMMLQGKSDFEIYQKEHEELTNFNELFEEPVRSLILTQEQEPFSPATGRLAKEYCRSARALSSSEFLEAILGPERARKYLDEQLHDEG